jgi:two-component system OmpR family sensor kinase
MLVADGQAMLSDTERRLVDLLQSLLDLPALTLAPCMSQAATLVAAWFGCDKVDAFLLDESRAALVAVGTSETPLGRRQKAIGLDVLPLANGGPAVETFQSGKTYLTGRADLDPRELVGIVQELGVRSEINVAMEVGGVRRGVLAMVSQQPEFFTPDDVQVLEVVARWISALAHRAELSEKVRDEEGARARTAAAEQILAVLAHDIRNHLNPLASRLQLLKLLLERGEPIVPSSLAAALAAVARIARLTSTWLDISRLDHGLFELELAPTDLSVILRETAEALATPRNEVQVRAPEHLVIIADAERLRQALENVVANAVRHSPGGRPVRVVVEETPDQNMVRVTVSDEGPGIPPAMLPHLFERFVTSRPSRGLGLGLHLAERVVAAHGGTLRAQSTPGKGAHLQFELPRGGQPG